LFNCYPVFLQQKITGVVSLKFTAKRSLNIWNYPAMDDTQVCGILDSNAFESLSARGEEVRTLYPLVAMCNSSCAPNATHVTTREHQLRLVAARRIKQGEEIFVCYTGIRYIEGTGRHLEFANAG
jgi:hypothetical protein